MIREPILVIGAGASGIAAAAECAAQSPAVPVILCESKPYIGGKARSFVHRDTGETIDNGQHILMGCNLQFLLLSRRLGTEHLLQRQEYLRIEFADAHGVHDVLDCSMFQGAAGIIAGIMRLRGLSYYSKASAILFATALKIGLLSAENLTAGELLRKYKQTDETTRRLWEPLIYATLNASPEQASAKLFIEIVRRAFLGRRTASQILIAKAGLGELFSPVEKYLEDRSGRLLLNATVNNLIIEEGRVKAVQFEDGRILQCGAVVSAAPPRALRRFLPLELLDCEPFNSLDKLEYSPIISVYLWYDRPVMKGKFTAMLNATSQWAFNRRELCDAPAHIVNAYPGHITITISAAATLANNSTEDIARICADDIRRAFPEAAGAKLLSWKVIKEKSATLLAAPHIETRRPFANTLIKNLFLAGDWTATGLPATLEGAAQSGVAAATAAMNLYYSER